MKCLLIFFSLCALALNVLAIPLPDNPAPDFTVTAVVPDKLNPAGKLVQNYRLSDLKGRKRVLLLTYPKNCTFICPTELIALNKKLNQFKALNYEVLVLSTDEASNAKDAESSHQAWRARSAKANEGKADTPMGIGNVGFVMLSDTDRKVIRAYGVQGSDSLALRATFFIDMKGRIRIADVQSNSIGRDVGDLLRKAAAVKFSEENEGELVPPEGWQPGDPGMKPGHEDVRKQMQKQ